MRGSQRVLAGDERNSGAPAAVHVHSHDHRAPAVRARPRLRNIVCVRNRAAEQERGHEQSKPPQAYTSSLVLYDCGSFRFPFLASPVFLLSLVPPDPPSAVQCRSPSRPAAAERAQARKDTRRADYEFDSISIEFACACLKFLQQLAIDIVALLEAVNVYGLRRLSEARQARLRSAYVQ